MFLEFLEDYESVEWQTLLEDLLGGVPVLPEEELHQPTSQARLPIATRGMGMEYYGFSPHRIFGVICARRASTSTFNA